MNHSAEFLLDAIGLVDDELILDAELAPPIPARSGGRPLPYYLSVCAAALVLCLGLNALLSGGLLGMGSGDSSAAVSSNTTASSGTAQQIFCVYTARGYYQIRPVSGAVSQETLLPLGTLARYQGPDSPLPATDDPACVGKTLWQAENGLLYIRLDDNSWLGCFPL